MSSQFLSLEEAAKQLGISPEELVSMRSAGKVRGFRDGTSWKFPVDELTRLSEDLAAEADDYDPYRIADSDDDFQAAKESPATDVGSAAPSAPGKMSELDSADLELSLEAPALTHDSSDLDLGLEPSGSGTGPLVGTQMAADDSGLRLQGDDDLDSDDEVLGLGDEVRGTLGSRAGAELSGLELMEDDDLGNLAGASGVLSDLNLLGKSSTGSSLISGDSGSGGSGTKSSGIKSNTGSGLSLSADDDDDLLITDNEDELVLGGGSDLSISGDSGINLMSPSDSGISLESEPLDLAGSSISSLDLAAEIGSGIGQSGVGSNPGGEDFQLSPSGIGLETDNDSSSQVIEVEDSAAFAEVDPNSLDAGDFGDALDGGDAFGEADEPVAEGAMGMDEGFGEEEGFPVGARAAAVPTYEVPYSALQVLGMVCILTVMSLGGMLMSDLVRNIWTYSEPAAPVSGLTDWLIDLSPFGS
jgi:hypothetical protein